MSILMKMNNKCYQGGKRHKFVARYSEEQMKLDNKRKASYFFDPYKHYISAEENRRLSIRDVYVHDICVWCGKIKKGATNENKKN